ncbi:fatty acid desaturase [Streptomyces sp. NBC_01808]|uniref:fatty acid desaturase family protein n=1 Tax=Streptomyces sp. NBC_01808 TaxID=2975947 RepID=UPI002DDADCD9|nr:fatty acid desaturase [Streptomyces sp. NBC_01808]WSA38354.1 fatty acid desaturase [Streptomyces sp. NBC_01808]
MAVYRMWKHSRKDAILLAISVAQFAITFALASTWEAMPIAGRIAGGILLTFMMAYNIIVVSHLFTHMPWFVSSKLNAVVSVVNSANIGQSVQAYELTHVRNHHRHNNDRPKGGEPTRDRSSTYRRGKNGQHEPLPSYALRGAVDSIADRVMELAAVVRLWRVGAREENLLALASKKPDRRRRELLQLQLDRAAHCLTLAGFVVISWQWTVMVYLPAFFCALTLVNLQNYYRHYGANPDSRMTDSVSHYGRLYNLVTFNDGYHQEHHLSPATHWSKMPVINARHQERLAAQPRIVSPVPAMVGFLDRGRPRLHDGQAQEAG